MLRRTLYYGPMIHSISLNELEYLPSALLCVSPDGIIEWVEKVVENGQLGELGSKHGVGVQGIGEGEANEGSQLEIVRLDETNGEFLCPGLIDTHTVSWTFILILPLILCTCTFVLARH